MAELRVPALPVCSAGAADSEAVSEAVSEADASDSSAELGVALESLAEAESVHCC